MIWIYLAIGISAVVFLLGAIAVEKSGYYSDWDVLGFLAMGAAGLAAIICTFIAIGTPIQRGYDHRNCNRYEDRTSRETKFVEVRRL